MYTWHILIHSTHYILATQREGTSKLESEKSDGKKQSRINGLYCILVIYTSLIKSMTQAQYYSIRIASLNIFGHNLTITTPTQSLDVNMNRNMVVFFNLCLSHSTCIHIFQTSFINSTYFRCVVTSGQQFQAIFPSSVLVCFMHTCHMYVTGKCSDY